MLGATSKQQQALLVLELLAELLDGLIQLEDLLELVRDAAQALHDLLPSLLLG